MAADDVENGTGSKDRKTVTLVAEMVAGVSKQVESLDRLMQSEFKNMQRQIDPVSGLPRIVAGLIEKVGRCEDEIGQIKAADVKRHEYRIGPLTANLIGIVSVCVAVIALVVATHG